MVAESRLEPSGANRQESATLLLPGIDRILKDAGWSKSDLGALAVGVGPGSFTGVRGGVVTARTIAQALKLPLVPVSMLECLAAAVGRPAAIIMSGAMDHFFIAAYDSHNGSALSAVVEPMYVNLLTLKQRLSAIPTWYADEAARQVLATHQLACHSLPVIKNIATIQAEIAADRLSLKSRALATPAQTGALTDEFPWSKVEPLYLRGASVTLKKSHGDTNKAPDPS